jgi:head-tail adaptor
MTTETLAAGRLRHVIQIQDPVQAQVDPGEVGEGDVETTEWVTTFPNVRCEIDFGSPRELKLAGQMQSVGGGIVTLRWRPGLHGKQRFLWDDGGVARILNPAGFPADRYTGRTLVRVPFTEATDRPADDPDDGSA